MVDYSYSVRPLTKEEGGGYLAESLDFNGCMADGDTIEEAIHNLEDAITSWIRTVKDEDIEKYVPKLKDLIAPYLKPISTENNNNEK